MLFNHNAGTRWVTDEREGYIKDFRYGKIAVCRDGNYWKIYEYYCGLKIFDSPTLEQAVAIAEEKVEGGAEKAGKKPQEYLDFLINDSIQDYGTANGKQYTRLVKVTRREYENITSHARKKETWRGEILCKVKAIGFRETVLGVEYHWCGGSMYKILKRTRR